MWLRTASLATVLLLLSGNASAFASVIPSSGISIRSNENTLSKFLCGNNFENCYGQQLSTTVYVNDDKIYRTEVYNLKLPTTLSGIVNEQKQLLTGMQSLENKIREQNADIQDELQAVTRKLLEQNADISTRVKQDAELLKSKLMQGIRKQKTSLLRTLTSKLARIDKEIDKPTDADPQVDYFSSCAEAFENNINAESGIYTLYLPGSDLADPFEVYCLADPEGGAAWTVVQRRTDGSEEFYRDWDDYEAGFGDMENEFFIGLQILYALTSDQPNELWIQMEDFEDEKRYAKYAEFAIGDQSENYALNELDGFTGDAGDSMLTQKGQEFSTRDRDNDNDSSKSCAITYTGAWWYNHCHDSNLNGQYMSGTYSDLFDAQGIDWYTWHGHGYSLKYVHMAIRPKVDSY